MKLRARSAGLALVLLGLGAPTIAHAEDQKQADKGAAARAAREQRQYRVTIGLGFSHWYGGTFGAPTGMYTPGITVGFVLFPWLELQAAHTMSVIELTLPDQTQSLVGFETLGVIMRRELRIGTERLTFGAGFAGGVVHSRGGVRGAVGAVLVARWLIAITRQFSLGPFVDARALLYELAESPKPIYAVEEGKLQAGHSDVHVQIGVMLAF